MAVRVPTTTSVCLNCKINSDANAGMEFHEIFDEVGLELQLPFLVKTFVHIDLSKKDKQHLCDDCVNRLIELYDLDELAKEESCKTNNLKNMQEYSYNEESSKHLKNETGNFRYERENVHKHLLIDQNNTQANLTKSISLENKTFALTQGENSIEIKKHNKSEDKDSTEYQSKVLQDFNISLSSCAIKDEKSNELGSNENMEFISDDENQNVKIKKQSNANIIDDSKKFEIKEPEASQNFDISFSLSVIKDELESNEHMEFISDEENVEINKQSNTNIIVNVREEVDEAEQAYTPEKTHNENERQKDLCVEKVDDRSNQILNSNDSNSNDSNSLLVELKITEEKEAFLLNASRSAIEFNKKEHIDADDFNEQEYISDDTCSVEEENLIEKIILSEEYDQVDLNEYLDKVLITKFQDLVLNWEMECKLCLEKYYSFGELLKHTCMVEFEKEQQLSCIVKNCEEDAKDLPTLARHLILTHYDKLESTAIYGKCADCQKTFSNVLDLNKHSCCRNIKRKADVLNCKYCDLNFQSLIRYRFHMQFHLKNHRPKICLLCGDIFNNSNDFFEHTHYTHNPKSALVCERCDRFFKDIKVFNTHMKLHKDSKYKCTLCPKMYYQKFRLNRHMDIYHYKKSKEFQCEYCRKIYGYKYSYLAHIKSHAIDAKVKTFVCSICGLLSNKMEVTKEHIESDSESPCFSSPIDEKMLAFGYSCENCSLDFCTIEHLKAHRLSDSHRNDLFYCGMCRKSFNSLIHMRNHSNAHKDIKEWQESFPITRRFVCNIGDIYHYKKSKEFQCEYCRKIYGYKYSYLAHIKSHAIDAKVKTFVCSICGLLSNKMEVTKEHIESDSESPCFSSPIDEKMLAFGYSCENCSLDFCTIEHLKAHRLSDSHRNDLFYCGMCRKSFNSLIHMRNHSNAHKDIKEWQESFPITRRFVCNIGDIYHYKKSKEFQCEYCRKIYGYKYSYLAHIKSHAIDAKVKTFVCSICGLLSNKMEVTKEHIESDSESPCFSSPIDEKMLAFGYSCENCSLDFCTIEHLKAHRLSDSHRNDLFYCGMCRKSFNSLIHMRNHSNAHKDIKEWQESFPITRRFVCNIGDCQDFFSKWSALHFHKKRPHKEKTKEKPNLKCQICQQLYLNHRTLAIHVAKAHNIAKHKCSHCKRDFVSQNSLQKHIDRQHTPAECDICLKIYKNQINLELHITVVHNSKMRYFCKHCQKGYVYKHQLNIHEQNECKSKK